MQDKKAYIEMPAFFLLFLLIFHETQQCSALDVRAFQLLICLSPTALVQFVHTNEPFLLVVFMTYGRPLSRQKDKKIKILLKKFSLNIDKIV